MHTSSDLVAGRGQPQTDGHTPVLARRGILLRREDPFRLPQARKSQVRLNMRTYVADALEGGEWRKRAEGRKPKPQAVVDAEQREDQLVLYSLRDDVMEYKKLAKNTRANGARSDQARDLKVVSNSNEPAAADSRGLHVVNCGDHYTPVRGNLPETVTVREEWLQDKGVSAAISIREKEVDAGE